MHRTTHKFLCGGVPCPGTHCTIYHRLVCAVWRAIRQSLNCVWIQLWRIGRTYTSNGRGRKWTSQGSPCFSLISIPAKCCIQRLPRLSGNAYHWARGRRWLIPHAHTCACVANQGNHNLYTSIPVCCSGQRLPAQCSFGRTRLGVCAMIAYTI